MQNLTKSLFLFVLLSASAFAQLPPEKDLEFKGRVFSFYSNKEINQLDTNVEHAVITIHGSARNPDTYFKSVWGISKKLGREDSTIVVSPHFKMHGDNLKPKELVYTYEGWWIGNQSIGGGNISSFEVIDHFLKLLSNKNNFPNLKTIVVTGHSAGGHLTQRFALGSTTDKDIHGTDIKYVVANPGTYAYLTAKRPVRGQYGIFEVPANPACAYNKYKYGLTYLNRYMSKNTIASMIKNFIKRKVTYFLGQKDILAVEQTCQAALQGPHRLARGQNFKAHVDQEFPSNVHEIITVPGVGHTQYGMYTSEVGKKLLFE